MGRRKHEYSAFLSQFVHFKGELPGFGNQFGRITVHFGDFNDVPLIQRLTFTRISSTVAL